MCTLFSLTLILQAGAVPAQQPAPFDVEDLRAGLSVIGFDWPSAELELMHAGLLKQLRSYRSLRSIPLENGLPPALSFSPRPHGVRELPVELFPGELELPVLERPADLEQLAFANIPALAGLIRSREVSCVELCRMYLARLRRLDEKLACVISFTEERALAQAAQLDRELEEGRWRGPLHGIPWGAKDLLSVAGAPTTWGAKPFEKQRIEEDAAVVRALDEAGAVLIAKLSLGALAWGDVWFGGTTRNPWKPEQGSSGSSAGSASASVAGGVAFAIGSETLGSIVSPSARCGASALRPTYGRVDRDGAMALAWSMDKLGPICRSVEDAAIVMQALCAARGRDQAHVVLPYEIPVDFDVGGWRVGYLAQAFEQSPEDARVLDELKALEVELVPIELPEYPVDDMVLILWAEAATAFAELTEDGRDDELVRQIELAWPNAFRQARLIPAVEYLRANRLRTRLMRDMDQVMSQVDLYVHPSFGGNSLTLTNLTGHPSVVAPNGFRKDGTPRSISFTGQLFAEPKLLALSQAWQESTGYHTKHPDL